MEKAKVRSWNAEVLEECEEGEGGMLAGYVRRSFQP